MVVKIRHHDSTPFWTTGPGKDQRHLGLHCDHCDRVMPWCDVFDYVVMPGITYYCMDCARELGLIW